MIPSPDLLELLRYNSGYGDVGRVASFTADGIFLAPDSFEGVFEPGLVIVASAYREGPCRAGKLTVAAKVSADSGFVRTSARPNTGIPVLADGDYLFVEGAAPR